MAKTKRGTNQQRLKTRRAAVGSNNSNNDNNNNTTTTTTTNNGSGNNNNNNNNNNNAGISIKILLIVSLFCLYHVRNESGSIKGISMSMTDINNIIDFTSNYTTTAAATATATAAATAASFYDPIAGNSNNISSDDKNNNNNNTTISHKNNNNNNNVTILRSSSSKLSSSSSSSSSSSKATTTMAIKNNTINTINDNDNDNDNNISSIIDHPHAGAKYQNGSWGYIADPTIVRKRFLINYNKYQNHAAAITSTYETMEEQMMMNSNSMSTNSNNTNTNSNSNSSSIRHYLQFKDEKEMDAICNIPPGKSHEKESWNLLTQRIQIGGLHPIKPNKTKSNVSSVEVEVIIEQQTQTEKQPQLPNTSTPFPKIFCGIYTYEKNHDMIKTITETWGWRCDGFLAFSTLTEPEIGAVHLPHYEKESYNNMWQKTRSIWAYLYDNYLDDYDFFHLSGDDNHFVIENMKNYYRSIMIEQQMNNNTDKPLYLGHFWKKHGIIVCGGGAGYTMNRKALKIFVEEVLPKCQTKMIASYEDSLVGLCFRHHTTNPTIRCGDTSDEYGSQRMTGLEPNLLATFRGKEFARPRNKSWQTIYDLYAVSSGSGLKYQEELVSSQHIALHLLRSSEWQKRIHAILYKYSCPPETIIGKVFAAADAAAAAANTAITTIAATN